ncbi:hypothetical protein [Sulfurospirillum diekertiae]|nr:hypothetical protein [Sulfurospirillum diekertiae]
MGISIKKLEALVDDVVLPFEQFIMEDTRLARYLSNPDVAKVHNLAVAKLTIYIYSNLKHAYGLIQEGAQKHKLKEIPLENLREFYSLYFVLCREWNQQHFEAEDRFGKNLEIIEQFVYDSFAKENESKEEFFIYDSPEISQDIAKMHYKDDAKISAVNFCAEGSIDELDIQDILESCDELAEVVQDYNIAYDEAYFLGVKERLDSYATVLEKNLEFRDLGYSIAKLSLSLEEHLDSLPNHANKKKILVILNAIVEDLIGWTNAILKEKTAIDIHYLDASLFSSIIQFEMMLAPVVEEEDSLEFF